LKDESTKRERKHSPVDFRNLGVSHETFGMRSSSSLSFPLGFGVLLSLSVHGLEDRKLLVSSSEQLVDLVVSHLSVVVFVAFLLFGFEKRSLRRRKQRGEKDKSVQEIFKRTRKRREKMDERGKLPVQQRRTGEKGS